MNKSLEFNFWPILYDSIVFLCLQTQKVNFRDALLFMRYRYINSRLTY